MTSVYEELRLTGELCDAVIKVQNVEFQVHKVILCSCSPDFMELFLQPSSQNQTVYHINDITPQIMELIIKFAYTGSCPVTMDSVQELIIAADWYSMADITETCCRFLEEQLCPENCVSIWQFTRTHDLPSVYLKAFHCILNRFEEVVIHKEFLQFTVEELSHLIGRDDLIVRTENTVYEGVMRWIAHEPNQRKGHLCKLMSKIRLCLMKGNYIRINVLSNNLVKNDPQCLDMVTKASRILKNVAGSFYSSSIFRPRLPSAFLFVMGGFYENYPTNKIEVYDSRADHWIVLTSRGSHPQRRYGSVFLNGYIYHVGGINKEVVLSTVHRFDPITKTFKEVAPMHSKRAYISVTVLNEVIYAIGGSNGLSYLNSAECYQPQINQWTLITPMYECRSDSSCTVLQKKVYVFGGLNQVRCLESAEYYDPQTNQWTMISNMSSRRFGLGAVACQNRIYVVGGCDGFSVLHSGEVYNPVTDSWAHLPPMKTNRRSLGLEVLEDRIFAIGGFNGYEHVHSMESFDPMLNHWTETCHMKRSHYTPSCCVVYGFPNIVHFSRDNLP